MGEYAGKQHLVYLLSIYLFFLCCGLVGGIRVALAGSGSDFFFPSVGIGEKLISTLALKCLKNSPLYSDEMYIVPPAVLCPWVSCFMGGREAKSSGT